MNREDALKWGTLEDAVKHGSPLRREDGMKRPTLQQARATGAEGVDRITESQLFYFGVHGVTESQNHRITVVLFSMFIANEWAEEKLNVFKL